MKYHFLVGLLVPVCLAQSINPAGPNQRPQPSNLQQRSTSPRATQPPKPSDLQPQPQTFDGVNLALLICPTWEFPVPPVKNIPDCLALEESLSALGWTTVLLTGTEARAQKILDTISNTRIRHLTLYFGGHGVVHLGQNILVTAGVGRTNIGEGLALDTLIDLAKKKALTTNIYLDSCRTEFLPPSKRDGLDSEAGFIIPDNRAINGKSDGPAVNVFFASSDRKPAFDNPNAPGGVFSSALKAALDSTHTRDLNLTTIAGSVIEQVSRWTGPNGERQTPVLVLGAETPVGERVPRRKPAPPPPIQITPGVDSPAIYNGFNNKLSLLLVRPNAGLPEVHVYDSSKPAEPGKTNTPIGYFKAPLNTSGKDAPAHPGKFMFGANPPVPATLLFDGTRMEISFDVPSPAPPPPPAPRAVPCPPKPETPVTRKPANGKVKPPEPAPETCFEQPPPPAPQPAIEKVVLEFFDRRTLVTIPPA